MTKRRKLTEFITGVGTFSAMSFIATAICQFLPNVNGFLSIDLKDTLIVISSFVYGPIAAPFISLIVSLLEMITISNTGPWGFLMNFVSSTVFSLTASLIYKFRKSINFAILGLSLSVVITTVVMIGLNPLIVPLYSGAPREMVIEMITPILLPFNFAKTLLNSAMALLLYKSIITALRQTGLISGGEHKTTFNRTTIISLAFGGAFLLVSVGMLITMLIIF